MVIPAGTKRSSASAATAAPVNGKLNLNTATQAQLEALPSIGESYTRRIVDSRAVDGPYKSIDDLQDILELQELLGLDLSAWLE